jgi:chaperonin GroES
MALKIEEKDLKKFILIGDRVLLKPKSPESKTSSGLFLPPSVHEKEKIHSGYVLKVGPGYPVPNFQDDDESWKKKNKNQYIPLQSETGDLAVYIQSGAHEIEFNNQKYLIVPHSSIIMIIRDESLFE